MDKTIKLLLVEDEPNFGAVLKSYLQLAKYQVDWCKNGTEAFSKIKSREYQLCILDIMMPEMDGFTLAKEIKTLKAELPFIFLTAKGLKEDILKGFKLGAEDYLTKPFDSDILLEKIRVILDRKKITANNSILDEKVEIGKYIFHPALRKLKIAEKEIKLSPKENALLIELLQCKGSILNRSIALEKIWKENNYFTTRSMDVYIAKLRKHLALDESIRIENIHGNGFQIRF